MKKMILPIMVFAGIIWVGKRLKQNAQAQLIQRQKEIQSITAGTRG